MRAASPEQLGAALSPQEMHDLHRLATKLGTDPGTPAATGSTTTA